MEFQYVTFRPQNTHLCSRYTRKHCNKLFIYNSSSVLLGFPLSRITCCLAAAVPFVIVEQLMTFLNQACAWFLEIAFVWEVSMRMCVRPWAIKNYSHEISLNSQSNKSYCLSVSLYSTCYRYCSWAGP